MSGFFRFLHRESPREPRWRYPLHVHIALLFSLLTLALGLTLILFQSRQMSRMALASAHLQFGQINDRVDAELGRAFMPIQAAIDLLAYKQSLHSAPELAQKLGNLANLRDALEQSTSVSALFVAYDNGDLFQVRLLHPGSPYRAPAGAYLRVWSLQRHADGAIDSRHLFFDRNLRLIENRIDSQRPALDAREQAWFRQVSTVANQQAVTPMYVFDSGEIGATFVRRAEAGNAVVGADITVQKVSAFLKGVGLTPSSHLYLLDFAGRVLLDRFPEKHVHQQDGTSLVKLAEMGSPLLAEVAQRIGQPPAPASMVEHGDRRWLTQLSPMPGPGGAALYLAVIAPEDELLSGVGTNRQHALLVALLTVLVSMPLVWLAARRAVRPLDNLITQAESIRAFRFDGHGRIKSRIAEIDDLADSMDLMKSALRKFLDIGSALAGERHFDRLLARILIETASVGGARGGIVYLAHHGEWRPVSALGGGHQLVEASLLPTVNGREDAAHPVARAAIEGTVTEPLDPADSQRWFNGVASDEAALLGCAIPLINRDDAVIGVLLLLMDRAQHPQGIPAELIALMEALSGTVAAAIETQRLIDEQKKLLESFIQLIAGAIDAKSAYTGGHCQRVPVIARMLAEAASAENDGPFADFELTDDDWEALRIASWLHDCGKVTTPEYVVDKATRLETIIDRIHEIRTRFEVVKREAEITCLNQILAGGNAAQLRAVLNQTLADIDDDFAFVARCNSGEEVMTEEKIARIRQIAERSWQRTLDDRIGISRDEQERKSRMPALDLPVTEPLLADRPDQCIPRQTHDWPDATLGLRIDVPHWLYNRGEIHNLTIPRGTLTPEERYKINDHINQTIAMLSRLPLPQRLRRVPEIAGGHHERADGRGYPKQLRSDQMSVLARMMAVADVFEALTAGDRPYKPAKTMEQALVIMEEMAGSGHLDPDIYALFLRAGVWSRYAQECMPSGEG